MPRNIQFPPASVPVARQAGEVRSRWEWTEECVWTDRMLATLETGVKGGKWFSLIDKVYAPATLQAAFARVKRNQGAAGVDHQSIDAFEKKLSANLAELSEELRGGSYRPRAVLRKWISKGPGGGKRPLGIPTVRDRVVQGALRSVLEPIFERTFSEHSYGFRPQRGCKDALREVEMHLKTGHGHIVDADLKSYFDTISHERLMSLVAEQVSDGQVLSVVRMMLQQGVLDDGDQWTPEGGTPQGSVISPLLANIFLNPLDQLLASRGMKMVRYADDFVVTCDSRKQAAEALEIIGAWVKEAELTLHPEKTRLVDMSQPGAGFDFLGYHFEAGSKTPRKKSMEKLKDRIREHTQRNNGYGIEHIIKKLNGTLRGWFEYFKNSNSRVFPQVDYMVRRRLRAILRKQRGQAPSLLANRIWPNKFFSARGLFSVVTAREALCQSSTR